MRDIVLLELFSGIGGFTKGFMDAGYTIKKHYFSEIDKHAIANYKHNFKESEYVGSVTDVLGRNLTRPNVITFGSPCQDFSLAGKRKGMEGQRSSLILHAIRLIRECRPDIFIWENVKGTFSSNSGADFWAIIQAFANIGGYRLEWQLLNTVWVLPQNRERIYLVGHLDGASKPGVFPIGEELSWADEGAIKAINIRTLTAGGKSGGMHSSMTLICAAQRGRNPENPSDKTTGSPTEQRLEINSQGTTNTLTGVQKDNLIIQTPFKQEDSAPTIRNSDKGEVIIQVNPSLESGGKQPYQQNRVYDSSGKAPALMKDKSDLLIKRVTQNGHGFIPTYQTDVVPSIMGSSTAHNVFIDNIRRLTEIECERLQGFPDNWTEYGNYDGVTKKIPKTQRYKMCGNAVTVDIVKLIANLLNLTL